MKIFVINNFGGGFADTVEIPESTTIKTLFEQTVPHARPEDYLIRLNRGPVAADYILQDGDRVSITPRKIEGAA
ncbi:MAG: molybdopterin converting factor [Planctomycetaceae bacterium]|nr:molybdopterin converting factor [Planctomycetaceae bacterium]